MVYLLPSFPPSLSSQSPNSNPTKDVLIHISQQLSNSTIPAYAPAEFTASPTTVVANLLFFLSLALVLIGAFLAMLVKSWLQEFDRGWGKHPVADLRAQERERRLQGLERWKVAEFITLLPILIQSSLLSFCIGLIVLLIPLHLISAIFSSVALVAGFGFYAFTTYVSVWDVYAPFSSPVSRGLVALTNILRKSWRDWREGFALVVRTIQRIIPGISPHAVGVAHPSSLPQGDKGSEKKEVVTRSRYQIDPHIHAYVLNRLATAAEVMKNTPLLLVLLDQPVNYPALWPSNFEKWKQWVHIAVGSLGDSPTISDSVARTIARNTVFWYDGRTADLQLSRRLGLVFNDMSSGQSTRTPLNYYFVAYLVYCKGDHSGTISPLEHLLNVIVSLEPSNVADAELLWMVSTIPMNMAWKRLPNAPIYHESLRLLAAVLTYVSSTEQSRRSEVPLTAAVIHVTHSIKSAYDKGAIDSILGHDVLRRTVLTTSDSISMTFHRLDALDLWSDPCVEFASALLQPNTDWSETNSHDIWMFQLPLIAALYIDSTRHAGRARTAFSNLLTLPHIPDIAIGTWARTGPYGHVNLAVYWYMALFGEPLYPPGSPSQDIGHVIMQTVIHCSEIRLSALYLLDASVKHLHATATSSIELTRYTFVNASSILALSYTLPTGKINHDIPEHKSINPWVLFHLDTLLVRSSILTPVEFEQLEWTETPEQVHIAKARLALYDPSEGEEHNGTGRLRPDPQVLKMFLWSKDYAVCTGAFKWCLNLVTLGQSNAVGMFIPETVGSGWIEHLIQVLFGDPEFEKAGSWEFLAEYFVPKLSALPPLWCSGFASAFLLCNINPPGMPELHAYQRVAESLRDGETDLRSSQLHGFLPFLVGVVELIRAGLTWDQVISIENWLTHLPAILENQDARAQLENILANRKQALVEEIIGLFAELPMAD